MYFLIQNKFRRLLLGVIDDFPKKFSLNKEMFISAHFLEVCPIRKIAVFSYINIFNTINTDSVTFQDQHISTHMLEEMGQKFCEGLLRLGRGKSSYETNFSLPSESGLEQLGAYGNSADYL